MMTEIGLYALLKAVPRMPARRAFRALLEMLRSYWRARVSRGATGEVPLLWQSSSGANERFQIGDLISFSIDGIDYTGFVRGVDLSVGEPQTAMVWLTPDGGAFPALQTPSPLLKEIRERLAEILRRNLRRARLARSWSDRSPHHKVFGMVCRRVSNTFGATYLSTHLATLEADHLIPPALTGTPHPTVNELATWLDQATDETEEIRIARHLVACSRCLSWAEDVRWMETRT